VDKDFELNDAAAIVFSQAFYQLIFHPNQTYSVCEAFISAYEAVQS